MLTDPKGKKIYDTTTKSLFEYTLVSNFAGNYQLCITNNDKKNVTILFTVESGVQATDYTNIVQKQHLKPIELQAQMIQDGLEQIRKELGNLVVGEERLKESNSKIKFRVVVLGLISVVVMAVTTFL